MSPGIKKAFDYANGVVKKTIPANKYVQLACKRFLKMASAKRTPYVFVAEYPDLFFLFVSGIKQVKGQWAGEPYDLRDWQCLAICMIYGFRHRKDPTLRWRNVFIFFLCRKSGKSSLISLIGLFELVWSSGGKLPNGKYESASEVYCVAVDQTQARIVWDSAWAVIDSMEPGLARFFKRTYLKIAKNNDILSQFKALSKNVHTTADGKSVQAALIDEAAQITNRMGIDVLESGAGSRRSPILCYLTTASHTRDTRFYEDYTYLKMCLDGRMEDNTKWDGLLFELDEKDDPFEEKNWFKASPMLGQTISLEYMRDQARMAKDQPEKRVEFLTKHLNVWVNALQPFIDTQFWEMCQKGPPPEDFGEPVARYMTFDLAAVKDLNAVCMFEQYEDENYYLRFQFFLPQGGLDAIPQHYKSIFQMAIKRKSLTITHGNVIDYETIYDFIAKELDAHHYLEIGYDDYNSSVIVQKLESDGHPVKLVGQSVKALNAPTKYFERCVIDGSRLYHDHDPFLTWQLSNCQLWTGSDKTNTNQNVKVVRGDDRHAKIDGVISAIMGFHCLLDNAQIEITHGLTELGHED